MKCSLILTAFACSFSTSSILNSSRKTFLKTFISSIPECQFISIYAGTLDPYMTQSLIEVDLRYQGFMRELSYQCLSNLKTFPGEFVGENVIMIKIYVSQIFH